MIRNFVYLDSDKLRSISSQIFEGVVDQVIRASEITKSEYEEQKGKISSGRVLGDIFSHMTGTSERKFMEDHAYNIFEDRLDKDGRLYTSIDADPKKFGFLRVSGRVSFNDHSHSSNILRNFNSIGEALWRTQNEPMTPTTQKVLSDGEVRKRAIEENLHLNQRVADATANIIEFGYGDLFEIHMNLEKISVTAPLKRSYLREDEQMLIHKYSRSPTQKFTIVGIITQVGEPKCETTPIKDVIESDSIKEAMRLLSSYANVLERTFSEPGANEIILDPIAIYSELPDRSANV